MAVNASGSTSEGMSAGRRFAIGANVTLAIIAATALLIAVNWLASITLKSSRKDVAAYAHFGLSDRTKRILDDCSGDVQLSVLYAHEDQDARQRDNFERLQDYGDELQRYSRKVNVKYVTSETQREELAAKIGEKSGGEAEKHREALASFAKLREELGAEIQQRLEAMQALMTAESSWLGDFPQLAGAVSRLRAAREALDKAAEEVKELTPAGGIPKYAEATSKAKQSLTETKEYLDWINKNLADLAALADQTSKADSADIALLRSAAQEVAEAVATLRQTVGANDAPFPEDPAAALRNFKEQGDVVAKKLEGVVRRVEDFAHNYPLVRQHASWNVTVRMGAISGQMEVPRVIEHAGTTLGQIRLAILSVLDRSDPKQLLDTLARARESVTSLEQNATVCRELLTEVADRLSRVDAGSKALLDAARGGALLAERVKAVDELTKTFGGLPELKLGSVADQLKQENTIVIDVRGKVRVLGFADVFPVRESMAGPASSAEEAGRTFNGDAAVSSAILSLAQDNPTATVVLVSFEPEAPQQRNPFSPPPPQSWIPMRSLAPLRQRLEGANFKVKDWNLADKNAVAPTPEAGTENVYVLLPPAPPAQPNPFNQQQQPSPVFGEEQLKQIRDLLANDARMIFLATWSFASGGPFGGPPVTPPYGYGPLLDNDWGIVVDNSRRIVWIEPDRQKLNTFMVAPRRFNHMPAGGFTDDPIGEPMRGTRFLANDACPIEVKKELPVGVRVATVLRIPARENYIAAKLPEMIRIIDQLQSFSEEGRVTLTPFPSTGPFDIMVAAERREGEAPKGKIVVMGFGASVRGDYLENPVPVVGTGDVLRLDPPPTENVDLFANALYWLQGQTRWIARGPVPVPQIEPIEAGMLRALRAFTYGVWPLLVFAPGVFLWWARRR